MDSNEAEKTLTPRELNARIVADLKKKGVGQTPVIQVPKPKQATGGWPLSFEAEMLTNREPLTPEQKARRNEILGYCIRELRRLLGWTQRECAIALGGKLDPGTVARWERATALPHPRYRQRLISIAEQHGYTQLMQLFADPRRNWKAGISLNLPKVTSFITRLEIVALNAGEHDEETGPLLQELGHDVAELERVLVARYNAGEEIMLFDDEQQRVWLEIVKEYSKGTAQGEQDGKKTR